MHKKDKNIWNKDILGIYPKDTDHDDKYDGWDEFWLIPIFALIDICIVVFKIGSIELQKKSKRKLKVNGVVLFVVLIIIVIGIIALLQNI